MSSIFPLRDTVTLDEEREPRLVEIDEDTADEVFEALSSSTTRQIFLELHNAPQTASDLADVTETSVQNVQYHLTKLQDADLIEVVDTWYSERGSEMKVYAPQDESLVLFAGRDKQGTLRSLLNRIVGVLALLVPTSVLAGLTAGQGSLGGLLGGSGDTADGGQTGGNGAEAGDTETDSDPNGGDTLEAADQKGDDTAGAGDDGAAPEAEPQPTEVEDADAEVTSVEETPEPEATPSGEEVDINAEDVTFSGNQTDPEVATDGGQQMTPQDAVDGATEAADAAASVDPAIAAGVAFFLGGLLVFSALMLWYGTPDSWS
jgi:DNA-binding transcriptional ArsR family regulator